MRYATKTPNQEEIRKGYSVINERLLDTESEQSMHNKHPTFVIGKANENQSKARYLRRRTKY